MDHGKSQDVRLLDVFVLGPFMLWVATQDRIPAWARAALGVSGAATIIYNWNNYRRIKGGR